MNSYSNPRLSPLATGIIIAIVAAGLAAGLTYWFTKDSGAIQPGSVTQADIATGAVGRDQLAVGAVSSDKLAADAITAENIPAEAITDEKLAAAAVGEGKIADGVVGAAQLKDGSITAAKIAPGVAKSLDAAIARAEKQAVQDAEKAVEGSVGTYTPTVTIQSKNFSGSQAQVSCPGNSVAIAGGVTVNNESVSIMSDYPTGSKGGEPTGWAVMLSGPGGGQVYATCLK